MCKGVSFDCPELPTLASTGDTTITPPLLNHGHYLKGNMPHMLLQSFCRAGGALLDLLQCWVFPAAPRCRVQTWEPTRPVRLPAVRSIKPGSPERPHGQPLPSLSANPEQA